MPSVGARWIATTLPDVNRFEIMPLFVQDYGIGSLLPVSRDRAWMFTAAGRLTPDPKGKIALLPALEGSGT